MGARWLTDLADICRGAGLAVVEVDGWQTRAHGSGGYDQGRPDHVMVHHTASGPSSDGWPDVDYCTFGDDDAPLCNLYLSRDGTVYVCAAGATNTNGSGIDPCGLIPDDSMNTHAVGIEAGNNGTGERWPDRQLDAYSGLVAALCAGYNVPTGHVHSHAEYAPTRKSDPAGPDRYAPGPYPWDMAAFRADVAGSSSTPAPTPPPQPGGFDMAAPAQVIDDDGNGWVFFRGRDGALWFQRGTEGAYSLGGQITDAVSAETAGDIINIYAYATDGDVYLWQFRAGNLTVGCALVAPPG